MTVLRLLHVEDSADDAALVRCALANAPFEFTLTRVETGSFLVRAAIGYLIEPRIFPISSPQWLWIVPQQVIWYAAMLLAIPGALIALRRDPLLAWLLIGLIASTTAIIAPNSGNIGTVIRHRDAISPFVLVLAAVGLIGLVETVAARARGTALAATARA